MIIKLSDLKKIRQKNKNKKIVFCSGTFDILHPGHVAFFEFAKKQGNILVVGVGDDKTIHKYKGKKRPIMSEQHRVKMVASVKPVDYALIDRPQAKDLVLTNERIFSLLKPNVWVVNSDAFNIPYRQALAKKLNIKFVVKNKNHYKLEDLSTTKIIEKILSLR